jgi:hypothetical protein
MPKISPTDEQIAFALRQAAAAVGAICRMKGVAEATFYRWKIIFSPIMVSVLRPLL